MTYRTVLVALLMTVVVVGAQSTPQLAFVSPPPGAYVTGPTTLQVVLRGGDPADVDDVTYFANGMQICVTPIALPCEWDAGPSVGEHALRAVARLRSGGRLVSNVRTRGLTHAESVRVDIVQANAVVLDGSSFVRGLTKDDFRLLDEGRERPIASLAPPGAPLEIVLGLDISGSMEEALEDMKRAAGLFLERLRPQDRVTVVAFNDALFTLTARDASREATARALETLRAWGGTALYDAISQSLALLGRQPGRHALVLFTDGEDQSSQLSLTQLTDDLRQSDVTMFPVVLGRGRQIEALETRLQVLAELTGGRTMRADNSRRLSERFSEVLDDLNSQYTLGFEPIRDGTYHRLTVQVPGKGYRVRARRGYTAPAS
jgi:Ca-activated chloride channel homolog